MICRVLVVSSALFVLASCSLLIERNAHQCDTDGDCIGFPGTTCDARAHICRANVNSGDGGIVDPGTDAGGPGRDVGAGCGDAGACYACTPTNDIQYGNACTDAKCQHFDNRERLRKLPADGGLTPLPGIDAPSAIASSVAMAGAPVVASTRGASGAVDCASMSNVVYIVGSTAIKPFLAEIAKVERSQTPPVTLLYSDQGSCVGVSAILSGATTTGPFTYWDEAGAEQTCTVQTPVSAQIGVSDVFATTCARLPGGLPSNVGDFLGPVQSMTFVVPMDSMQTSFSAEAAYYVYGFGADSGAWPWTDETRIYQRDALSGTQRMVAAAIGVDATRWRGTPTTGSSDMKAKISGTRLGESTIGILSAEVAQESRPAIRILSYQHYGQNCGYYPDKDDSSNDKQNVRDGHYAIWGPLHLFTLMASNGYPANAQAGDVIGFMTGTRPAPGELDLVALQARRHLVPQCAMRVSRSEEVGPLSSFAPSQACGCYYEKVSNGTTACTPCSNKTDCPPEAPFCNYGYCEMH
jgi:ABC-type phosphate transport system substrate-binding protein